MNGEQSSGLTKGVAESGRGAVSRRGLWRIGGATLAIGPAAAQVANCIARA
jgi:hypothetical protein